MQKLHEKRGKPKKHRFGNMGEPEVVLGYQLAEVLQKFCSDWVADRPLHVVPQNERRNSFLGPVQWIAHHSGLNIRVTGGLCNCEFDQVSLSRADAVLTAIGRNYLLATGEIPIVQNPRWSMEKWQAYMAERGCI